jgi:hypothetical protein
MEEPFDINKITKAIDNDQNEYLLRFNSKLIKKMKNDILQKLQLSAKKLKEYHKKLQEYIYVTDLLALKEGSYLRWIPLRDPEKVKLTNGGILVDTKITDDGIQLLMKNRFNRFFQIKFDECIVFQKLRDQEQIILTLMDELNK